MCWPEHTMLWIFSAFKIINRLQKDKYKLDSPEAAVTFCCVHAVKRWFKTNLTWSLPFAQGYYDCESLSVHLGLLQKKLVLPWFPRLFQSKRDKGSVLGWHTEVLQKAEAWEPKLTKCSKPTLQHYVGYTTTKRRSTSLLFWVRIRQHLQMDQALYSSMRSPDISQHSWLQTT